MLSHVSIRDLSSGWSFDKVVKVQVGVNLKVKTNLQKLDRAKRVVPDGLEPPALALLAPRSAN